MHSLDPDIPPLSGIQTPVLVIAAAALEANIARMALAAQRAGVALRPHAKTHKSPDIARMQLQAGAIGIACATLLEAEELSRAGIGNLLITSPVVGRDKVARLARLHRHSPMMVVSRSSPPCGGACPSIGIGRRSVECPGGCGRGAGPYGRRRRRRRHRPRENHSSRAAALFLGAAGLCRARAAYRRGTRATSLRLRGG